MPFGQFLQCIYGIAFSLPEDFNRVCRKTRKARKRLFQYAQPVFGRQHIRSGFHVRITRRDEPDLREAAGLHGFLCDPDMSVVHRVETSAEDTDLLSPDSFLSGILLVFCHFLFSLHKIHDLPGGRFPKPVRSEAPVCVRTGGAFSE